MSARRLQCRSRWVTIPLAAVLLILACSSPAQDRLGAGTKAAAEERWTEAIAAFDEAIAIDPELIDAYLGRALARYETYDTKGAIADLDVVIARRPDDASALGARAASRARLGDADGAVADAEKAVELDADDSGIWESLGLAGMRPATRKDSSRRIRVPSSSIQATLGDGQRGTRTTKWASSRGDRRLRGRAQVDPTRPASRTPSPTSATDEQEALPISTERSN
jgi:tetratricopeptide (TPR) repeat protein